jgi:hypothetical protein
MGRASPLQAAVTRRPKPIGGTGGVSERHHRAVEMIAIRGTSQHLTQFHTTRCSLAAIALGRIVRDENFACLRFVHEQSRRTSRPFARIQPTCVAGSRAANVSSRAEDSPQRSTLVHRPSRLWFSVRQTVATAKRESALGSSGKEEGWPVSKLPWSLASTSKHPWSYGDAARRGQRAHEPLEAGHWVVRQRLAGCGKSQGFSRVTNAASSGGRLYPLAASTRPKAPAPDGHRTARYRWAGRASA